MKRYFISCFVLPLFLFSVLGAKEENRKNIIVNGNRITTEVWNYGSFSAPGNRTSDFRWKGLGYAYEINFFVGAEVEIADSSHADAFYENGKWLVHIISDGLKSNGGEVSPGRTMRWGWQPVRYDESGQLEYLNTLSPRIAGSNADDLDRDGKADSWPDSWWDSQQNAYLWPGLWPGNQRVADEEFLYGMDDRDNLEFEYYPFTADSGRGGLGVAVEVRGFQIQDFYEDILFVTFDIVNISDKDLDKMLFGFWGDPHIGGADDWNDDWQAVDKDRQLIYAWDDDGKSINSPIIPGYFGLAFLQTAGNDSDGIDNDNDGMIDESPYDGIDNDGDWQADEDDLGADGIAATGDAGEGDGMPTPGEPDFEWKDMDETDMLGVTSFGAPLFSDLRIFEDERVWQLHRPGQFDTLKTPGDFVLTAACGYFSLKKGQHLHLGMAFLFGDDYNDLLDNLDLAREYYTFHLGNQTVEKPFGVIAPDSGSRYENTVSIRWDPSQVADDSRLEWAYQIEGQTDWQAGRRNLANSGQYDWDVSGLPTSAFYKIRMRWYNASGRAEAVSSGNFIIDHSGTDNAAPEVLFDLADSTIISDEFTFHWRSADADGDDLQHRLIFSSDFIQDTVAVSGQSYRLDSRQYPNGFYRIKVVVSDGKLQTDSPVHTVQFSNAFPLVAEEYIGHISGYSTAAVKAAIVAQSNLKDKIYIIGFSGASSALSYSVRDSLSGDYLIRNETLPLYPSSGTLFDGLRLSFENPDFALDSGNSGWTSASTTNMKIQVVRKNDYPEDPFDYEIRFYDDIVDTSVTQCLLPFEVIDVLNNTAMKIATAKSGGTWEAGDDFFILRGGTTPADIVWEIRTSRPENENLIGPGGGDIYRLYTLKPLSEADQYTIDIKAMALPDDLRVIPLTPVLYPNYPNPFNAVTTLRYRLPRPARVEAAVYNILGQKVAVLLSAKQNAGTHRLRWDTSGQSGIASGVYLLRMKIDAHILVRKMILIK